MGAQPLTLTQVQKTRDDEAHQRPLSFTLIKRIFSYTRSCAAKRNILVCLVIVRAIQLPFVAWALGAVMKGPVTRGDMVGTMWGALGFGALAALTQLTLAYRQRLAWELGERVVCRLRSEIFDHVISMPMSFYNKTKLGRIISRVISDVESVKAGVQDVVFVTMVALGQMIVSAAIMLYYDWALFLVVACMAPVIWGLNQAFKRRFSVAIRAATESFSRITATLAESVSGIRVTQGYVRQEVNADIFKNLVTDHSRYNLDVARIAGIFLPMLEFTSQLFIAMLLLIGGWRVMNPDIQMSVGALVQFFFLAGIFFQPIQNLGNQYNQALTAMAGAERVFNLLDTPPEWADDEDAADHGPISGRVEFRNVSFGYDPKRTVLHEVNILAEPGRTIALVGHTGSGKTTIINLLAKFYLPYEGEVLIDGINVRKIKGDSLHRQMGIIQQQNFLFSGTLIDNIKVGRPEASDADVVDAARKLDCLDIFEALPDGFQTQVGERGAGLSLDQRQLVCFVRAMVADPKILILDEATSSVDTMTEARIQKSLASLIKGRTCFVIAHRMSTIRHADMVLVLNNGRIIERGKHLELLAKRGVYANLYRQFIRSTDADAEDR